MSVPARYLFSVDEYERMGALGLLQQDDRVELIEGEIVWMAPIGSPHAACVDRLNRLLVAGVGDRAIVRVQSPIRLGTRSEPQPDLSLLRPRPDFYASGHPGPDDVMLVVEVADTTVAWDRGTKARLYAAAGVLDVWVVDIPAGCVHVLSNPGPGGYLGALRAVSRDVLTIGAMPGLSIAVGDVLGES